MRSTSLTSAVLLLLITTANTPAEQIRMPSLFPHNYVACDGCVGWGPNANIIAGNNGVAGFVEFFIPDSLRPIESAYFGFYQSYGRQSADIPLKVYAHEGTAEFRYQSQLDRETPIAVISLDRPIVVGPLPLYVIDVSEFVKNSKLRYSHGPTQPQPLNYGPHPNDTYINFIFTQWGGYYSHFTNAFLLITTEINPGDFSPDGKVNAIDYVVWRNRLGTLHSQVSIDVWRANFGFIGGNGPPVNSGSVPEPCTLFLLAIGAVSLLGRRRRLRHGL